MRVLGESWCFCSGGGKSERMKAAIFGGKAPSMAIINGGGSGFLIHRNLLLTTHANLPSVAAVEAAEIRLHNGLSATLFPNRFFITSSVHDLTMVGLDSFDGESNTPVQQPHYLKTSSKPNLNLGSIVYLLGYTDKQELTVGEGKVIIATDNLIKLSTDGIPWSPGSAGFDLHGNLAFMVCDPMKLATSPNNTSTSSSSTSSWKKDHPTQFGIPIPIIRHWLSQHWDGNLDELNKPKLPLIRLMSSSGQKSEHSCTSFTMRQVFKSTNCNEDDEVSRLITDQPEPSSAAAVYTLEAENMIQANTNTPGIPPLEIGKKDHTQVQLLDINFPPRILSPRKVGPTKDFLFREPPTGPTQDAESTGSVNGVQSEIKSRLEVQNGYSSEGETTMYSAETAESRNFPSPRENRFQQVGRSQSCVNYKSRWGPVQNNTVARGAMLEKHRNFVRGRKVYSQGAGSQRSNEYCSPTVSSIMKKRNNMMEQRSRPRISSVHTSPKWNF